MANIPFRILYGIPSNIPDGGENEGQTPKIKK
jgi:hypothetical protein